MTRLPEPFVIRRVIRFGRAYLITAHNPQRNWPIIDPLEGVIAVWQERTYREGQPLALIPFISTNGEMTDAHLTRVINELESYIMEGLL